jgi:uncharacterized protein (TIGR02271 family)
MREDMDRIVPLDQMEDFEIAEGEPDVRGWNVLSSDGEQIGEVDQLLVDTTAMKVRYLDVDLDEDRLGINEDRHILTPIGYARLDEDRNQVVVERLRSDEVTGLPPYRFERITPEYETSLRQRFEGAGRGRPEARRGEFGRETRMTRSEEELAVGKREVSAGEVDIEKHVETEHVRRPVELTHEEVEIERRPVTGARAGERARIEEQEIHVPLSEEEAVVEKRPVVREELVVRKRPVEETEEVEADLRREVLDVEEHGRIREAEEGKRRRGR